MSDIMEEVLDIKSMYFALGRSLRLRNDDLQAIRKEYPNESGHDAEQALNDVLLLWLKKEYNEERFGPPTWRMLVEAVNKKSGGNNYELAKQIASNHPAGRDIISYVEHNIMIMHDDVHVHVHVHGVNDKVCQQQETICSASFISTLWQVRLVNSNYYCTMIVTFRPIRLLH